MTYHWALSARQKKQIAIKMDGYHKDLENNTMEINQQIFTRLFSQDIMAENNMRKKAGMMQYFAQQCRIDVLDMLFKRQNGHWGGSASSAELLTSLYFGMMNIDPSNPDWEDRDRLVLSKGHAAPMLYTILANRGYFPIEELKSFRELNSMLQGHPCRLSTPGVEMSTGALGHGISTATGMALAAPLLDKQYRTFVIVGDGCLNEGETWEGIMSAAKFKPARLVIMVDYNKVQLDGPSDEIMPLDPLADKFKSFNLHVADKVYDGHNVWEILESWDWIKQHDKQPVVVIYKTHKGKGVSFMEDNHKWHGAPVDDTSYKNGKTELIEKLKKLEEVL